MLLRYDYCVSGDALIPTTEGLIRLDDLENRIDTIKVGGAGKAAKAIKWTNSGEREVIKITAKSGNHITCTGNHEIKILRNGEFLWMRADECRIGDYICMNAERVVRDTPLDLNLSDEETGIKKPSKMTPELAFILAAFIAEGHTRIDSTRTVLTFDNSDRAFVERYVDCVEKVFGIPPAIEGKPLVESMTINGVETGQNKKIYSVRLSAKSVAKWFAELGVVLQRGRIDGKTASYSKEIPWSILQADIESQRAFLAAYLEGDGSLGNGGRIIQYHSVSEKIVDGLRAMLNAMGYVTVPCVNGTTKGLRLGVEASVALWNEIAPYMVTKKLSFGVCAGDKIGKIPSSELRNFTEGQREEIAGKNYFFSEIVSISDAGRANVYDITMEKGVEPAFIANGIIVHNCAHEVRVWSIASGDMTLAESFRIGQKLRQQFIAATTEEERAEIKKELKTKGDIHIANCYRFFNKWVSKDDPLRDAVKAVVFGVLYGKSAETLGVDTKQGDLNTIKGEIAKLYDESINPKTTKERFAEINRMMEELDHKLAMLMAEDRTEYAQGIIDKMFSEFKRGAAWTEKMQELAEKEYYVYSPIGRRRFLPAALTGERQIVAQQVRRGSNAPIQGFASEIGIKASRLIMETYYDHLETFLDFWQSDQSDWDMRIKYNRVVHDANYFAVPYEMLIPMFHISQYMATYGVTKAYKEQFNVEFTVEPEVEFELGAQDANSHKVDWSLDGFVNAIKETLKESEELGLLDDSKEEILKVVMFPWKNKKFRNYLQNNFPLLGVEDLDEQISAAVKNAVFEDDRVTA